MLNGAAVYICESRRSAIGRYGGSLSGVRPDDLAAHVIAALLADTPNLDPEAIDDVVLGCANQAGEDNRNVARMAVLLSGLPPKIPGVTINRLCASGLDAVGYAARLIGSGDGDLAIAGGVESMSRAPYVMGKPASAFSRSPEVFDTTIGWRFVNSRMMNEYGSDAMPETAENVAEDYAVSREDQDAFALRSHMKASAARLSGVFDEEIAPIEVPDGPHSTRTFAVDEHIRPDTTLERLASLRATFRPGGSITPGNASGVNDGAAAMILASEQAIKDHHLTPEARIIGLASVGTLPRVMGIGPVEAVRKLNDRNGLSTAKYDVVELNEAFASQALAVLRELGLPDDAEHVNPNGGAIALGHPLGMSGARIVMAAGSELRRRDKRLALATMCVGVGQGCALAMEAA